MTSTTSKLGADMTDFQINLLASHYWEIKEVMGVRTDKFDAVGFARALLDRQPAPSVEHDERGALIRAFDASLSGVPRYVIDRFGVEHLADGGGWIKESDLFDRFAASTSANVAQGAEAMQPLTDAILRRMLKDENRGDTVYRCGYNQAIENVRKILAMRSYLAAPPAQTANVAQGAEAVATVKVYETYTGQNGWTEVAQEEYDRTKDKYEHRIRRVPAPPAQTALTDAARECLLDVTTHFDNLRAGLCAQRSEATNSDDGDGIAYWNREIRVLERMKAQAERALTAAQFASGDTK